MKSYKMHTFLNGLRFSWFGAVKENKWKIILSFVLVLTAISTGIFVAVKSNNSYQLGRLQEISLMDFYSGFTASASAFFSRSISLLVNISILTVLSFSVYLFPLAEVLFIYRGYLFGLNFALIFIFYGIGSSITAIVVILPCQLITLFALIMFYVVFHKLNKNCKIYGKNDCNRLLFFIFSVVVILLINLVETLMLCLLNGKVIMVI